MRSVWDTRRGAIVCGASVVLFLGLRVILTVKMSSLKYIRNFSQLWMAVLKALKLNCSRSLILMTMPMVFLLTILRHTCLMRRYLL